MTRPVNPNISIPAAFAVDGQKTDFTAEKLQDGFDPVDPDVLAGDNLNKFIDDTYKGLNYSIDGVTDLYDVTDDLKDLSNLSATGQAVLDGKASTDLSNLTTTGEAHFAKPALSNLSSAGEARLHALKSYEDAGELLTDSEGLADVTAYAHSTYDSGKFNILQSSTFNITDAGIVSGFNSTGDLTTNQAGGYFNPAGAWVWYFSFTTPNTAPASQSTIITTSVSYSTRIRITSAYKLQIMSSSNNSSYDIANQNTGTTTLSANTKYYIKYEFTGTQYILSYSTDGINYTTEITINNSNAIYTTTTTYFRFGKSGGQYEIFSGSIDLKDFAVYESGVPTFNGNLSGSDSYTINGSTVTIPYTLSKTGSKIVDSAYRTDVASVYSAFGFAPYYTLSDSDFTLPQGELYGFYEKSAYYYLPDWENRILIKVTTLGTDVVSSYTAPENGYISCDVETVTAGSLSASINNLQWWAVGGSTYNASGAIMIPVKKGDVYSEYLPTTAGALTAERYFIPTRGV